jgi:signal transduction histidine kinase
MTTTALPPGWLDRVHPPEATGKRRPPRRSPVVSDELHERALNAMRETALLRTMMRLRRQQRPGRPQLHMLDLITHDLANAVGAAQLSMAAVQRSDGPSTALSSRCMGVLERSLGYMERLVADLQDARQMQLGQFVINPKALSPDVLVSAAVDAAGPRADGRTIVTACAPRLAAVRADERRVQRVFANLIGNAIKFTDTGGIIAVGARPGATGDEVIFFVRDNGDGIPEGDQARIFEPYWRGRNDGGPGTGLGLTICRGIIEAHGGRMFVTSRPNVGSTFAFTLPSRP